MKFINALMILFIFSFSFCMSGEKNGPQLEKKKVVKPKDNKVKYKIPDVRVEKGDSLIFDLAKNTEAVIIIPNSDLLFDKNDPDYINYDPKEWQGITFLIIPLPKNESSKDLTINKDANTGTEPKSYPYSVYYPQYNFWAEGESSPEIIVDP